MLGRDGAGAVCPALRRRVCHAAIPAAAFARACQTANGTSSLAVRRISAASARLPAAIDAFDTTLPPRFGAEICEWSAHLGRRISPSAQRRDVVFGKAERAQSGVVHAGEVRKDLPPGLVLARLVMIVSIEGSVATVDRPWRHAFKWTGQQNCANLLFQSISLRMAIHAQPQPGSPARARGSS